MEDLRPPQLSSHLLRHWHPRLGERHLRAEVGDPGEGQPHGAAHQAPDLREARDWYSSRPTSPTRRSRIFSRVKGTRLPDGNFDPSETDFGDFTISNDVCEGHDGTRYHCALRYLNTDEHGKLVQKWLYKTSVQTSTKMHRAGVAPPAVDYHVQHPDDWREVPGGYQPICFNEVPTKVNWHYLRWSFDTRTRRNTELQVNDLVMDLRDIPVPVYEVTYKALSHLLNFCIDVRTHRNVRNFLYLDSVLALSGLVAPGFRQGGGNGHATILTAVVERNVTFDAAFATEPYEAGWAERGALVCPGAGGCGRGRRAGCSIRRSRPMGFSGVTKAAPRWSRMARTLFLRVA